MVAFRLLLIRAGLLSAIALRAIVQTWPNYGHDSSTDLTVRMLIPPGISRLVWTDAACRDATPEEGSGF